MAKNKALSAWNRHQPAYRRVLPGGHFAKPEVKVPEGSWWLDFDRLRATAEARMKRQRPDVPNGGVFGGEK